MAAPGESVGKAATRRSWWLSLVIGSALVVAVALAAAVLLGQRGPDGEDVPTPLSSRIGLAARAALVALGSDEVEFEAARAELLRVLDARRDEMPEDSHATVARNLEIIEAQISAISEELSLDPDNPRLARLLAAAYQRELELLQLAAALPKVSRTDDES